MKQIYKSVMNQKAYLIKEHTRWIRLPNFDGTLQLTITHSNVNQHIDILEN